MKTISFPGLWHFPPFLAFRAKKKEREKEPANFPEIAFVVWETVAAPLWGFYAELFFRSGAEGIECTTFPECRYGADGKLANFPSGPPKQPRIQRRISQSIQLKTLYIHPIVVFQESLWGETLPFQSTPPSSYFENSSVLKPIHQSQTMRIRERRGCWMNT